VFAAGCGDPPRADADDLLQYLRNAEAQANVRRLDPESEAYAEKILEARHAWQTTVAPITDLEELEALWAVDAGEWRDAEAVAKRLKAVTTYLDGCDASPAPAKPAESATESAGGGESKSHAAAYAEIIEAIADVPSHLSSDAARLKGEIPERLKIAAGSAAWQDLARAWDDLLSFVAAHQKDFAAGGQGLTFAHAEDTNAARDKWNRIHARLMADRQAEMARLARLTAPLDAAHPDSARQDRAQHIKRKQDLRAGGDANDLARARRLELDISYYDTIIKTAEARERRLRELESKRNAPDSFQQ
jgi:hypothetical protein